jgi:TRAP-type C4-dicarboxylate transport system permease small subunit
MSARAVVFQSFVGRIAILLLWSLALWGALLLASAVTDSFSEGSVAFARLVPARGANVWSWLAGLCVVLAVAVVIVGGAFLATKRLSRGDDSVQ